MSDTTAIRTELTELLTRLAKAQALEDRFPVEPPDGSILKWNKPGHGGKFDLGAGGTVQEAPREYTYVALRVGATWYLTTARGQKTMGWPLLRARIGNSPAWLVTELAEIPRAETLDTDGITDPAEWIARVYGDRKIV